MPLQQMYFAPGICKTASDYGAGKPLSFADSRYSTGRYIDGNLVRFTAGFPEKLGGWASAGVSGIVGIPRAMRVYRDAAGLPRMIIGTETHLYTWDGTTLIDITPQSLQLGSTVSGAVSTVSGSPTVTINDPSADVFVGDWIYVEATVGGLTLANYYQVVSGGSTIGSTSPYTINAGSPATSTVTNGTLTGAAYPRRALASGVSTVLGSNVVTINVAALNLLPSAGQYVNLSAPPGGSATIGGIVLTGQYPVTSISAETFTISANAAATATVSGGGPIIIGLDQPVPGLNGQRPCWSIWAYGNQALAAYAGDRIYVYDHQLGGTAYPLLNGPINMIGGMLVTPERFVVALGTFYEPTQVSWADQSDYTDWTTTATNTAETGRQLQGGSAFVGGCAVRDGVSLILTDTCVFQMTYSGDTFIYDTPLIADNAGLIGPNAIIAQGSIAYWMGDREFWTWDGSVTPLPSDDIRDYVFRNLNMAQKFKCFAATNRVKKEVWFFYPSLTATEINNYVIFHTDSQCWSIGQLSRTAWVDASLFQFPYATDANSILYQHEIGTDANGASMDCFIKSAPIDISNGDRNMDIMGYIPDFQRLAGNISLSILTRYYPQDADNIDGPYVISPTDQTPRVDLRSDGKLVAVLLESNAVGGDFRLGQPRIDVSPSGARR